MAVLDIDEHGGKRRSRKFRRWARRSFLAMRCPFQQRVREAVLKTIELFDKINILCNNTGIAIRKSVPELKEEEWNLTLDVTLKSVYLLSREVIPHMVRNGGEALSTPLRMVAERWAKAAGLLCSEGRCAQPHSIHGNRPWQGQHRVNCVCPGDVDTPMLRSECKQLGEDPSRFLR